MIESDNEELSVKKQCGLIKLRRGTWYDRQDLSGKKALMEEKKKLAEKEMSDRILSIYAERISLGSRGMRDELIRRGHRVNRKKVQRLMRKLGLKSQAPGPHTSLPRKDNSIYPYLLKDAVIKDVDEVWSIDITYIRVGKGFMYLTAIIDWYSRYIVAWELSNSMDVHAQLKALDKALASGRKPKIFNTDQGSQFTSNDFTGHLKNNGIHISMDGRGRAVDNIFIERFWRTIKYEWLCFWTYDNGHQLRASIAEFIELYNFRRCHSAIYSAVPSDIYIAKVPAPDLNIKWEHLKGKPLRSIDDICSELPKISVPLQKKSKIKNYKEKMTQTILT
jgi:putative transposase